MDLISLSLPLSLLSLHRPHRYSVFVPAFLFLSLRLVLFSRSRSAFFAILSREMSLAWTWTMTHCKPLDFLFPFLTTELTCQVAHSHLENDLYFEFWLTIYITMIRNYIHVPHRAPTIELTLQGYRSEIPVLLLLKQPIPLIMLTVTLITTKGTVYA